MLIADVSNVNGRVNFQALKAAGVKAVWLKAAEGLTFNDRDYVAFRKAANKAGLRVGAYHFAHPEAHTAVAEAAHFAKVIGRPRRTDLRPVLDFETGTDVKPEALEWWARRFNQVLKEEIGTVPVFYSYPAFIEAIRPHKTIGDGLWLASYSKNDGKDHPFSIPAPWKKVVAHQFTSKWTVAGHDGFIDLSYAPKLRGVLAHPLLGL
jgi:lysozyme